MIGIFDSGAGGLAALRELRRLNPREDVLFLADRKNAPYGTKSEDEILRLTAENIKKIKNAGAKRVLIACCTASTVYEKLPFELRKIALPIIDPTADLAVKSTENSHIAVIATEHTVRCSAFSQAIKRTGARITVTELEAQILVGIAECVAAGEVLDEDAISKIEKSLLPLTHLSADTLILGCTHFSHLKNEIRRFAKNMKIIDSAKTGAQIIAESAGCGIGATVFL